MTDKFELERQSERLYEDALLLMDEGNIKKAIETFFLAAKSGDTRCRASRKLAEIYQDLDSYDAVTLDKIGEDLCRKLEEHDFLSDHGTLEVDGVKVIHKVVNKGGNTGGVFFDEDGNMFSADELDMDYEEALEAIRRSKRHEQLLIETRKREQATRQQSYNYYVRGMELLAQKNYAEAIRMLLYAEAEGDSQHSASEQLATIFERQTKLKQLLGTELYAELEKAYRRSGSSNAK